MDCCSTKTSCNCSLTPLDDRVILAVLEENEQSPGGIFIPEVAREKPQRGRVMKVGPGRWDDGKRLPMTVQEGQTVLFAKYGGTEIRIEGKDYKIVSEKDILAIIQ